MTDLLFRHVATEDGQQIIEATCGEQTMSPAAVDISSTASLCRFAESVVGAIPSLAVDAVVDSLAAFIASLPSVATTASLTEREPEAESESVSTGTDAGVGTAKGIGAGADKGTGTGADTGLGTGAATGISGEDAEAAVGADPGPEAVAASGTVAVCATRAAVPAVIEPGVRPNLICMSDVVTRPVDWLWADRIPAGRISMVVGVPGLGKSFLTCDMAARVSNGHDWPDGSPCGRGSVLFITAEDDPGDTIRPRLEAHGADLSKIHLLSGALVRNEKGEDSEIMFTLAEIMILEDALGQINDCRLIVVDPIGSFLGGRTDAHRDNEVRAVLAPLAMLAEQSAAAVMLVAHRRKSGIGSADDSVLGSRAFTGLARAVWHLSADPQNGDRRLWLPGKNNLAKRTSGLAFRISGDPGRLVWDADPVNMSADDAMERERGGGNTARPAYDEAADWLVSHLDENGRSAAEVKALANQDGIAGRTLDRAAKALGVLKEPGGFGGPWVWRLPSAGTSTSADQSQSREGEKLGETGETVKTAAKRKSKVVDPLLFATDGPRTVGMI